MPTWNQATPQPTRQVRPWVWNWDLDLQWPNEMIQDPLELLEMD